MFSHTYLCVNHQILHPIFPSIRLFISPTVVAIEQAPSLVPFRLNTALRRMPIAAAAAAAAAAATAARLTPAVNH